MVVAAASHGLQDLPDAENIHRDKTYVLVLGVFASIAVVLAAIGVYDVLSYFVNQRTRELGIRFALGAQRRDALVLVAKLGLTLAGTGLVIGIALALGLNRFIVEHLSLFHVKATDPATYAAVGILLLCIALLACYIPARRAINVDGSSRERSTVARVFLTRRLISRRPTIWLITISWAQFIQCLQLHWVPRGPAEKVRSFPRH
jgi:predicted lysophospholipase L1 biosynthesis ABC-type transport system permease subunit